MPAATVALRHLVDEDESAQVVAAPRTARTRWAYRSRELRTPIALSSNVFAARCSMVLTLILYFGAARSPHRLRARASTSMAARHHRLIGHPDDRCFELIGDLRRTVGGADYVAARAVDFVVQANSHRLAGDRFTRDHHPARRSRLTVEVIPEGSTRTASPILTVPAQIKPDKPRKSRFGRLTHCTGIRNGLR